MRCKACNCVMTERDIQFDNELCMLCFGISIKEIPYKDYEDDLTNPSNEEWVWL